MAKLQLPIPDICIYSGLWVRQAYDNIKAIEFSALIARSEYRFIKESAEAVFFAIGHGRGLCPQIWEDGHALIFHVQHSGRYLYIRVAPGKDNITYLLLQKQVEAPAKAIWQEPRNNANRVEVCTRLTQYVVPESTKECEDDEPRKTPRKTRSH